MIIAGITVYKCDGCPEIHVVQSADEEATFKAEWFTSLTKDFCPTCKISIEHMQSMIDAEVLDQSAFNMLDAPASAEEAQHVS